MFVKLYSKFDLHIQLFVLHRFHIILNAINLTKNTLVS